MTDLKPCHVCGSEPWTYGPLKWKTEYSFRIEHCDPGHECTVIEKGKTPEEARQKAIEKWNRRTYE